MSASIETVADALLYEGYALYPYRRSSLKNRAPWLFGTLLPPAYVAQSVGEHSGFEAQLLVRLPDAAAPPPRLRVRLRYLQLVDGAAHERRLDLERDLDPGSPPSLAHADESAPLPLVAEMRVAVTTVAPGLVRVAIGVENRTAWTDVRLEREHALPQAMAAAHCLATLDGATFVSLLDPPGSLRAAAATCLQRDIYPVLAGPPGDAGHAPGAEARHVLCAPIILYDFPQVAANSAGDLFDGLEIDEILSLRIQTLSEDEIREVRAGDPRTRAMLERTLALAPERLLAMHGEVRPGADSTAPWQRGQAVRLRPARRADIFDMALDGKTAVIEAVEQDLEGNLHIAVVLDDDPGREFGLDRQIGHRFFFGPEEIEPLLPAQAAGGEAA